jgi:hypothetical protein
MRRLQDHWSPFVRFFLGGQAVVTWYTTLSNPTSTLHALSRTSDGGLIIWVVGILGILLWLDLFVNDWTPPCVRLGKSTFNLGWENIWKSRHWLFVGIAGCYCAQPQIADVTGQPVAVAVICYWWAIANMVAAFIDAGDRSRRL